MLMNVWFCCEFQEEMQRLPKAVLQQHCQKNGWPSPKYEKFPGRFSQFCYSVTVVQPTTGRGKSKKVGGPVTIRLPEEEDRFNSIAVRISHIDVNFPLTWEPAPERLHA